MIDPGELLFRLGEEYEGTDPGLLETLIDGATAYVEAQTRRTFGQPASHSEVVPGTGTRRLWLPEPPAVVEDAFDVEVVEAAYPGAPATTFEADVDFEVRTNGREGWLMRLGGGVWREGYEYHATYTHGYKADARPADVVDLVAGLVALRLQLAGMEAVRSESIGGYQYTRFGEGDLDAIPGARATIEAWKRPVLA